MAERIPRKLAAILYADVVGYSRLTGADEDATHRTLTEYLDLITTLIESHGGRVMHYAGDAVLASFSAVVDALSAAVAIQTELGSRNEEFPDEEKLQFRIGINSGDVIEDRGDIYGEGVNVAARLESLADPGGICVSDAVRVAVGDKLHVTFEDMGERKIKNIATPVHAFRVVLDGETRAARNVANRPSRAIVIAVSLIAVVAIGYLAWISRDLLEREVDFCAQKRQLYKPDRPSVAVLPFDDLSTDVDQSSLGDVMSESITTTLAKVPNLFVIARNSTAVYKGEPTDIREVADELGVRYVIEGSVQREGGRMRITAQLIDSESGHHLWAERYDRDTGQSFAMMDEISLRVLNALEVNLTEGEQARIRGEGTENLKAYQLYMQARKERLRFSPDSNATAIELAQQAIDLDPDFWGGWTELGFASASRYWYGSADKAESLRLGTQYAEKALEVGGPDNPDAYVVRSFVETWKGNHDESIALARKALELSPNMVDAWGQLGVTLNAAGRSEEAIPVIENAMRLSPYYPNYMLLQLGKAYRYTERHEEAIFANRELLCRSPDSVFTHRDLALSYAALGEHDKAADAVTALLKIQPDYSIQEYNESGDTGIDPAVRERNIQYLRRAGLPG